MSVTVASFRTNFPEFADTATYPDSAVNYWLDLSTKLLNACRWGALLDHGTEQFVAHNLVLEALAQKTVAVGGLPGLNKGVISAESPGAVSLSYDTSAVMEDKAGHWNYTVYGTRFVFLMRRVGAGPIQVGLGSLQPGDTTASSDSAWSGPPVGPGWLGS